MDIIYEMYMGAANEDTTRKIRNRIHWICDKVQGERILDVGCSQGITDILLGRKGLRVTGLDICEESIEQAKQYLAEEPESVQNNVDFLCGDFFSMDSAVCNDTIIMGEVLEHLQQPELFVEQAARMLKEGGRLIVTVPFGIMDHPDHRQTFYYFDLIHLLEKHLQVIEVKYLEAWIGMVATKVAKAKARETFGYDECRRLEQEFYKREREHLNRIYEQKERIEGLKGDMSCKLERARAVDEGRLEQIQQLKQQLQQLKQQLRQTKQKAARYDALYSRMHGTWYGKFALSCYRALKKSENCFQKEQLTKAYL